MMPKEIKMIAGPFAGNNYQRYDGKPMTTYIIGGEPIKVIPGDYYRGLPEITTTLLRSPGCMPAKYLADNPTMWEPVG